MNNENKRLSGASVIWRSPGYLILTVFAILVFTAPARAAYQYQDKIEPGVSSREQVENEFGAPVESLSPTTFKYEASVNGLDGYVVEYGGEGAQSELIVERLDIEFSEPFSSKKMAEYLGLPEPEFSAVNSEGKYQEFFGDKYSVIFTYNSDSSGSGVVTVSFLTGEGFDSLMNEIQAEPAEPDTTAAAEGSEIVEETEADTMVSDETDEGTEDRTVLPEEAADGGGDAAAGVDESTEVTGAGTEVVEDTPQAREVTDGAEDAAAQVEEIEGEVEEAEETARVIDADTGEEEVQGEEVATLTPDAKMHMQQGMMYVSLARANPATEVENYSNALLEFSNAIERYPNYTEAYSNRGVIYLQTNKYNLAKRDLEKAAALSPNDPYVQYNLAALYSVKEELDLSIEALDKALANGFANYDALRPEGKNSDPDLHNLRESPEFKQTLEKYKIFILK